MTLSLSSPISAFPLKRLFFPTSLKPSIPTPVFLSLSLAKHCLNMSSVPVSLPKYDFQTNWDVPQFSDDQMDAVADETLKRYSLSRDRKRNESGVAIVWFRNDLRVLDNEALFQAWKSSQAILPVYCLDPRLFGTTHYFGFPKTGVLRAQFLIDCLANLKKNLMKRGLNLLIQHGKPEDILPSIAKAFGAHTVYAHQETCSEEILVEKLLTNSLRRVVLPPVDIATSIPKTPKLQLIWGSTMYHLDDLPFGSSNVPDVYTQFRKSVESKCKIRGCIKIPPSLGPLPSGSLDEIGGWGCVPSLDQLGLNMEKHNGGMHFIGGENAALARVNEYFWNKDLLRVYKETRNAMLGPDYSTKFSPWLAFGCLSPRYAYEEVKRYEKERVANDSTYWVLFELIWRDYFRFLSIKYANSIFHLGGPRRVKGLNWNQDMALFESWRDGRTGYPLIDANMKELNSTGFMSNRGRQIVCSFLVRDMGLDWRMGAEWFETCLVDYDPCSNYGNWTYGAGVGNDPREDRYFSIPKQAQTYDPEGEYVSYWLPELRVLPKEKRHFPGTSYIKQVVPLKFGNANPRNSNQFKGQSHRGGFERRKGQRS
ncbi:cryptochrome DASH, chloroplastic/mitochondrial isoform X2 [Amborella trichopoda]|uniref:cryptochrome DASH, chloroplastic/mitochondrial isoform X2 n=1 Tax=Amborella trichopoda TaxID=13333 RepID=UPI0009BD157F|nr:cryptochrome DASH, chloroplastic/mitochondrial isoform X2 [Amborella trichopoda]|eukprot:XP_011625740.2 cryptochrome DASH, chloroplastic/mitochondrial isoform X2 [Amborella trichopoda]